MGVPFFQFQKLGKYTSNAFREIQEAKPGNLTESGKKINNAYSPWQMAKDLGNSFLKAVDKNMDDMEKNLGRRKKHALRNNKDPKKAKELEESLFEKNKNGEYSNWDRLRSFAYNQHGEISYKNIAGMGLAGYTGISAAGRIASGGGLYRDADGNFDVIGIPIV